MRRPARHVLKQANGADAPVGAEIEPVIRAAGHANEIAGLDLEESLLAKDVPLPQGVTLAVSPDLVVCHVAKLVVQAAPAPAEAEADQPAVLSR